MFGGGEEVRNLTIKREQRVRKVDCYEIFQVSVPVIG